MYYSNINKRTKKQDKKGGREREKCLGRIFNHKRSNSKHTFFNSCTKSISSFWKGTQKKRKGKTKMFKNQKIRKKEKEKNQSLSRKRKRNKRERERERGMKK